MWKRSTSFPRVEVTREGKMRTWHGGWRRYTTKNPRRDKDGYEIISIRNERGESTSARVHRLVAEAYIPNPDNKPVINHKNGIKDDNRVENLEWSTIAENTQHGYDELGVISPQAVKTLVKIDGKEFSTYQSLRRACEEVGIHRGASKYLEEISEGYITFESVGRDYESKHHHRKVWKEDQTLNTLGSFYKVGEIYYDKIEDIEVEYKRTRHAIYKWVKEGHPKGLEVKKVSCKEFLQNSVNKNW